MIETNPSHTRQRFRSVATVCVQQVDQVLDFVGQITCYTDGQLNKHVWCVGGLQFSVNKT